MRYPICYTVLAMLMPILSACTTAPKKPASLPNAQVNKLKMMRLDSRLPVPVKGISRNQLRDTWGGTKVYSATEGLVADLRNNNLGGKVIWILGPSGSWHYYAHLDGHKRGLNVGDYVHKGDLIGYVGNTGNARATAPHLHYGIYLNGKGRGAINPYSYLR